MTQSFGLDLAGTMAFGSAPRRPIGPGQYNFPFGGVGITTGATLIGAVIGMEATIITADMEGTMEADIMAADTTGVGGIMAEELIMADTAGIVNN